MNCKLTAIQIISSDNIDDNFQQIESQLAIVAEQAIGQPHLVLLPENALLFATRSDYLAHAEQLGNGPVQKRLSELAKRYQCTLVCGSFPIVSEQQGKIYTSSLLYNTQGELLAHYHKMHLFDADVADGTGAYRESDTFVAGQTPQVVDCGFAKIGLAICYDLRFPSLFQSLREQGAEIILLPAAFTKVTGEGHWQALLQARAIETQCYLIAANQGGEHFVNHPKLAVRETYGHSMIIDAWGKVIAQLTRGVASIQADFERQLLNKVRTDMPVFNHRQFKTDQI